ncbi:hypothetical protein T03_3021 [Trichinella britovi]|uniref:Uncharacterized protein n=1 Tax=Trichinella britovi TaxID=45882 RepID=A0A0V1DC21_TRIBR|nr:hypothetical protein T03_3021 [Trichinella britovi]KRZ94813.1 hypothetical protein T08_3927 [Trichinella sp. T8]
MEQEVQNHAVANKDYNAFRKRNFEKAYVINIAHKLSVDKAINSHCQSVEQQQQQLLQRQEQRKS